jgi:carboxyvinyl-carboxyphosphonate phosphorylmutase
MHWTPRRERFRALLAGEACVNPGSVFDPMSARIAEDLGYQVGILAGSVASMAALGAPDLIVLTLTELAEQCLRIDRAGSLPLIVDADHGFGNALNVRRTVEELETAGVAALTIEDTVLPRPFGQTKPSLTSIEEGVGKMKAALAGRQDKSLTIVGRTIAFQLGDDQDAVRRCKAYADAGVDALMLVGPKTKAHIEAVNAAVKLPIIIGGGGPELKDKDWLGAHNVRVALQGHQPFSAAVQAVYDTLKALREGTPPAKLERIASDELLKRVTRDAEFARMGKDVLGG